MGDRFENLLSFPKMAAPLLTGNKRPAPKCQLHTTRGSCWLGAGKANHVFGVCVPLALICLSKIVN